MTFLQRILLILLPLAAAGCMRGEDYVILPVSHPATPTGRPGVQLADSTALEAELTTVRPDVGDPDSDAAPPASGGAHQHHRH